MWTQAEAVFNNTAQPKSRYADKKPPEAGKGTNLTHNIERFIRIIPHIPAKHNINNHTEGEFNRRYHSCADKAANKKSQICFTASDPLLSRKTQDFILLF